MKRLVEVFTAGCPLCDPVVKTVHDLACPFCEVTVYDIRKEGAEKARSYGIHRVPAVVVNGKLVDCCRSPAVDVEMLKAAGVRMPIS